MYKDTCAEVFLKDYIERRVIESANYIIENKMTVRACARRFGVSKSTVHKDMTTRLPKLNRRLYLKVRKVLDINKQERHIRGGLATKQKKALQKCKAVTFGGPSGNFTH